MSVPHNRNMQHRDPSSLVDAIESAPLAYLALGGLDVEQKGMLEILGRTFFLLALGALAILVVSGDFPWFLLPLGLFLFFGCCLSWRLEPREGRPSRA